MQLKMIVKVNVVVMIITMLASISKSQISFMSSPGNGTIYNGYAISNDYLIFQINTLSWRNFYLNNGTVQNSNVLFPKFNSSFQLRSFTSSFIAYKITTNNLLSHYDISTSTARNITTITNIQYANYGTTPNSIIIITISNVILYQLTGVFTIIHQIDLTNISSTPKSTVSSSSNTYVGCQNGEIVILSSSLVYLSTKISHNVSVNQMIISPDELKLYSGDQSGIVYEWIVNGSTLSIGRNYTFHNASIQSMLIVLDNLIIRDVSGITTQFSLTNWIIMGKIVSLGTLSPRKTTPTSSFYTFQSLNTFYEWNITTIQDVSFICSLSGCLTCSSNSKCLLCHYGYININSTCQGICNDQNCLQCSRFGYINNCTVCATGYKLNSTNNCQGICFDLHCLSCSSFGVTDTCTVCQKGYFLQNSKCRIFYLTKENLTYLQNEGIVAASQNIFKTPIIKKALTAFTMAFLSLDELWIYQYHHRNYGEHMSVIFQSIRLIENDKWKLMGDTSQKLDDGLQKIMQDNTKYSSYKFVELQGQQGGFLTNTFHFFVQNIPISIISFLLLRIVFYLTRNYPASKNFRNFSFNGYFFATLLAGNLHYFIFLSINQCQMLFSFSFGNKIYLIIWCIIFFFIIFYATASFYIFKYFYEGLSKYFLDNQYRLMVSFLYSTFQSIFRNFMLGFTHSYLLNSYQIQIYTLIAIQFICLVLLLYFWKMYDCFKLKGLTCLKSINYILFIIFDFLLIAQQSWKQAIQMWDLLQGALFVMLIVIGANSFLFAIYSIGQFLSCLCEEKPEEDGEGSDNGEEIQQEEKNYQADKILDQRKKQTEQKNVKKECRTSNLSNGNRRIKDDVNKTDTYKPKNNISSEFMPKKSMLVIRDTSEKIYDQDEIDQIILTYINKKSTSKKYIQTRKQLKGDDK